MRCTTVAVSCTVPSTVPGPYPLTGCEVTVRLKGPLAFTVQGGHVDAAANVVSGQQRNLLKRPLHAVENAPHQARAQFDRQRPAQALGGLAGADPIGGFIGLHHRPITAQGDHFAEQPQFSDLDLLAVADARQFDGDDRSVDVADDADALRFAHDLIR
jgi:hypothetical protein